MTSTPLHAQAQAAIDAASPALLAASHAIHGHPELGNEEVFASGLLASALEEAGFTVEKGLAGRPTAFRAVKGRGRPTVAFLAEYDALPGLGHGCGHNLIATAALGAGLGLGAVVEAAGGSVQVIGTPAEETDGAKVAMAAGGVFDGVDAALMIHPYDGDFLLCESLAMDALALEYRGRPAHAAASPWEGRNALDALILAFSGINALRQQMRPDARIHGIITDGGQAPNVIPDRTEARFYVRARTRAYLDVLVGRFRACAEAAALATGTEVSIRNYEASFDDMVNNETLATRVGAYAAEVLGGGPFGRAPDSFGSIDMGNVSHVIPGAHVLVGVTGGRAMALHTGEFREAAASPEADAVLLRSAKALALTGLDLLADPDFLTAVTAEFGAATGASTAT